MDFGGPQADLSKTVFFENADLHTTLGHGSCVLFFGTFGCDPVKGSGELVFGIGVARRRTLARDGVDVAHKSWENHGLDSSHLLKTQPIHRVSHQASNRFGHQTLSKGLMGCRENTLGVKQAGLGDLHISRRPMDAHDQANFSDHSGARHIKPRSLSACAIHRRGCVSMSHAGG
ncbi:unannotated protein [freshwater metagenome]|uniref:Unannotated protein n=1 Tax=freshwater metagenome TaxID=449393 RepID=A0A6J7I7N5_9ZZZZ